MFDIKIVEVNRNIRGDDYHYDHVIIGEDCKWDKEVVLFFLLMFVGYSSIEVLSFCLGGCSKTVIILIDVSRVSET